MRLLFVIASMPVGGLEIFTVNLANEMAAKGHDVSILVFRDKAECLNLIKGKNMKIMAAGRNLRYDPRFLVKIALFLKDTRPQVILSLSEFAYFITEIVLRFLGLNIPHVIRFAWSKPITKTDRIFTRIFIAFSKFWKASYIFVSKVQQDYYRRVYRLPTRRSFLIYSGIDTNFFTPRRRKKNSRFTVAHIANIRPVKDQWTLMRAMAKFNNSQKSWRLLFVGNDRYGLLSEYKGFLCSERIRDKVQFHATHDRAKIREMLINSDVFVLTSLSEGLPNAPLEAMSVGIPCILTNVGGCGEIVRDGFNGFLVEPGDYEALSSRLLVLCNSRALLTRMGNRARKRVLATYSLDVCADNYMRVFQMLELRKSQL